MQWFYPVRPKALIGLDIQPHEIRLLKCRRRRNQIGIEKTACRTLPTGAVQEGQLQQLATIKACLLELVQETQSQGCPTAMALPSYAVISKKIQLRAGLSEVEREEEIAANVSHYFPGMSEGPCFDYVALPKTRPAYEDFFLVAARHEQVLAYFNLGASVGLTIKKIDVDLYALMRAVLCFLNQPSYKGPLMVLDLQIIKSQFIVMHHHEIIFYRTFDAPHFEETQATINEVLRSSCNHYRPSSSTILYISGDVLFMTEIIAAIEQTFKWKVVRYAPFRNLPAAQAMTSNYLIAYGLVIGGLHP